MTASTHRCDLLWLLAFGLASSAWCLTASREIGATFDEPFYIKAGLTSWRTGSNRPLMRAGTMTLPVDVQTLPIHLWEKFDGPKYSSEEDLHKVLPVARASNLVFWWLLLVYALRLGHTFGGVWGGRLATALTACDPNLLGHAALATTDIACTATFLVLIYHFWHGLGQGWVRRLLVPGFCFFLAIQAKVSGLVFGLEAMAILGVWRLAVEGVLTPPPGTTWRGKLSHLWHASYRLRRDLTVTGWIGIVLVFLYTGCDWKTEPSFEKWADNLPDGSVKSVMAPLSHHLKIFSNAGHGLLNQIKHNIRGHDTFFLGQWYHRATMPYFPVLLTMKLPIPIFGLLAAALLVHRRHFVTPIAAIALVLLLLSPNYRVQIGVRFVFPLMVITYIAVAAAIARGWAEPSHVDACTGIAGTGTVAHGRYVPRWFVAAMVFVLALTSVWIWPRGICYFNQLWGGPRAGITLLHESNYDWGQGLPELRDWCRTHGEERIAVWYYGMDPDIKNPPFAHVPLHSLPHGGDPERIRALCGGCRYLAVSIGCFCLDADFTPEFRSAIRWARTLTPVDRTMCFLIYRIN